MKKRERVQSIGQDDYGPARYLAASGAASSPLAARKCLISSRKKSISRRARAARLFAGKVKLRLLKHRLNDHPKNENDIERERQNNRFKANLQTIPKPKTSTLIPITIYHVPGLFYSPGSKTRDLASGKSSRRANWRRRLEAHFTCLLIARERSHI